VLTSFQRGRIISLEAGVKYLIIGALSTSFTVYGIALVYGISHTLDFATLSESQRSSSTTGSSFWPGARAGGLGFKITAFPFQIWAPDVYQGAPTPVTAFLAVGSKAAGFALLLPRAVRCRTGHHGRWANLLIIVSGPPFLWQPLRHSASATSSGCSAIRASHTPATCSLASPP